MFRTALENTYRELLLTGVAICAFAACSRASPPPEAGAPPVETVNSAKNSALIGIDDQAADKPAPETPPATSPPTVVQLSPYNLTLPRAPDDAPEAVRQFYTSASRAVQRVYEDDIDDPSILQALEEQLHSRPELAAAAPIWLAPLGSALARANTLRTLGPTLRALHQAMANAYFDDKSHSYRDVDLKACQVAFGTSPAPDEAVASFVVTIEPLGTFPVGKFRQFCNDSRVASMKERHITGKPAPPGVNKLVRRLYTHNHRGGVVRKIAVVHGWKKTGEGNQATLQALVGVRKPPAENGAPPTEPCVVERVEIIKPQPRGPLTLVDVGDAEAILCQELR